MTVAFAMLADYVVSMSVTPVVLAWLYQAGQRKTAGHEDSADEGWFRYVLAVYEPLLQGGLRFKPLVIGLAAVALVATGALLIPRLHTEFFPKVDAGNFTMSVTAPEGSRIEKTTAIVGQIEQLVHETIPKGRSGRSDLQYRALFSAMRRVSRRTPATTPPLCW